LTSPAVIASLVAVAWLAIALGFQARQREVVLGRAGTAPGAGWGSRRQPERSSSGLRPARVLIVLAAVACCQLAWKVAGIPGAIIALASFVLAPRAVRIRREARSTALMEEQLGDAVEGLASAIRAGMSMRQALVHVADESDPPISHSLRLIIERERMGVPLDSALEGWAEGAATPELRLVAGVLRLHHRVGGHSPAVLAQVARAIRSRVAAARELRSLTAQARLSGLILGLLPIGFFLFMSVVSRRDMQVAFHSPIGMAAVVSGLALDGLAFLWIRSLLRAAE
jgi:tight adherence protein B